MSVDNGLLRRMARMLRNAKRVVVFTGAGISAESGISTFRDDGGLWARFPPEEFAQLDGLTRVMVEAPGRAGEFLLAVLEPIVAAEPNAGHKAIAALETRLPVTVVTQNVDGLHEAAGSSRVLAVHGRLFETVYADGSPRKTLSRGELAEVVAALRSVRGPAATFEQLQLAVAPWLGLSHSGFYRPNIVLFGEALCEPDWTQAQQAVEDCDFFLSIGTSGVVYPAAALPDAAWRANATVVAVDPQPVGRLPWLRGTAGELVPRLVAEAFG